MFKILLILGNFVPSLLSNEDIPTTPFKRNYDYLPSIPETEKVEDNRDSLKQFREFRNGKINTQSVS